MLLLPERLPSFQLAERIVRFVAAIFMGGILAVVSPVSEAQVVSSRFEGSLDLGWGSRVTLPPGTWEQVTKTTSTGSGGTAWDARLLKNLAKDASIPFLVIHTIQSSGRWNRIDCTEQPGVGSQFLSNDHGATYPGTDRCSRSWVLSNFKQWLEAPSAWWKNVAPQMLANNAPASPMILSELRVQRYNGWAITVSAFITPPAGIRPVAFREAGRSSTPTTEHQLLGQWNALYVAAIEQSYINDKPASMVAFAFHPSAANSPAPASSGAVSRLREPPGAERSSAASAATGLREPPSTGSPRDPAPATNLASTSAREPSPPDPLREPPGAIAPAASPPRAAAPISASGTSTSDEQRRLEAERAALTQQMEKMRELLAQLQKANAEAAQAANQRTAQSPITGETKPATVFANRRALIVGNDTYAAVAPLENAVADANAMSRALSSAGFKVSVHLNLEEKRFKQVLRDFRQQIEGGDEVLFFFAGHGVQIGNVNYLLPVDIQGQSEEQIRDEAIPLQRILDDMQERKAKFTLAVIDACRDNPFKGTGRSLGGRGLAPTTAATGQMIMFSAGSGQQALDRLGPQDKEKNGLFTRVFVKEMLSPGVPVDRVLRNVRNEVVRLAKSVGHEQTPALYDQAIGEFYFRQ